MVNEWLNWNNAAVLILGDSVDSIPTRMATTERPEMNKQNRYYRDLGINVAKRLRELHSTYNHDGSTREVMLSVFGYPAKCLVCEKPLRWADGNSIPNDVDPWFCSNHCPICSEDPEIFS